MRYVAERRVLHRAARGAIAPLVHIFEPGTVHHVDLATRIRLCVEAALSQLPTLVRAVLVERGEDLLRDGQGDVWDVEERVRIWRRGNLVILREGARVDVEAQRARVGYYNVRDGAARVVRGQRVGHGLGVEGEERVVGGVGHPKARKGSSQIQLSGTSWRLTGK